MFGDSSWPAAARPAQWLGAALAAFGVLTLTLWVLAPSWGAALAGGSAPTKPATAAALLVVGFLLAHPVASTWRRAFALSGVLAVGVDGLAAVVAGRGLVFGGALFPDAWAAYTPDRSGSIAAGTAVCLVALAAGLLAPERAPRLSSLAGLIAFAVGYIALLGHLYGVSDLYRVQSASAMAIPTACAVLVAGGALLLHEKRMPVPRALHAPGTPGALVRQLLPWALLLPLAAGWLSVRGQERGLYDGRYGLALTTLVMVGALVLVVLRGARTARRIDERRERASGELEALNASLEERVAVAAAEAEAGRERLRILLERTPVGIFETAADGTRTFVNARWRELAGVDDTVPIGGEWTQVLHPQDRERVRREWSEALASGRELSSRYRYLRPDGEVTWVDSSTIAVRNAAGEVARWVGSVTDVTEQVRAAERLAESERSFRLLAENASDVISRTGLDGTYLWVSPSVTRVLGWSPEELVGSSAQALLHPDDLPAATAAAERGSGAAAPPETTVVRARTKSGDWRWLEVTAVEVLGPHGAKERHATARDVTERILARQALERSEEQFRNAMDHAPIGMALVEIDGRFRQVNAALCRIVGYSESELLARTFQEITHPEDLHADLDNLRRLLAGEVDHYAMPKRYRTRGGDLVWVQLAVSCARDADGAPDYLVAQVQDITADKAASDLLAHRALHDTLTGLPNRDLLMDHLAHALARSSRTLSTTAVMFCDLDGFKEVNDTHGHDAGDLLLVAVAERLLGAVRPGDTVSRLGGDEFVIVAEDLQDAAAARALAERVRGAVGEVAAVGTSQVHVSIGLALATPEDDARSVMREADAAMYRAKALGRDRVEESPSVGMLTALAAPPA